MIDGVKVIATTPCGRVRYMRHLVAFMHREHERGRIDEWCLFHNPIKEKLQSEAELGLADRIVAALGPWVRVFRDPVYGGGHRISRFFKYFTESNCVYLRLDDDIVYIDEQAIPRLIHYRIAHPEPYLVVPTIVNNVRTSYHMQQAGIVPLEWGKINNDMLDPIAWKDKDYVINLHKKALQAIRDGSLVKEFTLPTGDFLDFESGYLSINCFAMRGDDLMAIKDNVPEDEERFFALWQPHRTRRQNARVGDAVVCHFAYHTQTQAMDNSGLLAEYAKVSSDVIGASPAFGEL